MTIANTTIQIKKSVVSGNTPVALANGEIAINSADGKLFYRTPSGSISYIYTPPGFTTVNVGGSLILATATNDILTVNAGNNINISSNGSLKSVKFDLSDTPTITSLNLKTGGGGVITFPDGTTQGTAAGGAASDQTARNLANAANNLATSAYAQANDATNSAQSAYNQANAINSYATSSYAQANAANNLAQSAYNTANNNSTNINIIQGVDNTQNTNITATNNFAGGAFTQANASTNSAQAAYNQANATNSYATSGYAQANAANNLATSAYNSANTNATNISIIQGVNDTQNTNITAVNNFATGSFNQANASNNLATSAYAQANAATNSSSAAYSEANSANNLATSAYAQANAATNSAQASYNLANTTVLRAGDTMTGALTVNANVVSYNVYVQNDVVAGLADGAVLGGATNPIIASIGNNNNYVQTYILNYSTGAQSSADFVAYPNNGTDSSGWVDMGITGSGFSQAAFSVTSPNEGYLFMSAPTGSGTSGNLVISTDSTGLFNSIEFYTGGFNTSKGTAEVVIRNITSSNSTTTGTLQVNGGLAVTGNSYSTSVYTNGLYYAANGQPWVMGSAGGVSASGYLSNAVIYANATGYLSNTSTFQFVSANNTLISSNAVISGANVTNLNVNGNITEALYSPTISAGTLTLDISRGAVQNVAYNGVVSTLNINGAALSGVSTVVLVLNYNGTAYSFTWPASVRWPNGAAPTLTGTNGKRDIFTFFTMDGGVSYNASISGQNL